MYTVGFQVATEPTSVSMIEKLLAAGIDPNAKTDDGQTALDLARRSVHFHARRELENAPGVAKMGGRRVSTPTKQRQVSGYVAPPEGTEDDQSRNKRKAANIQRGKRAGKVKKKRGPKPKPTPSPVKRHPGYQVPPDDETPKSRNKRRKANAKRLKRSQQRLFD